MPNSGSGLMQGDLPSAHPCAVRRLPLGVGLPALFQTPHIHSPWMTHCTGLLCDHFLGSVVDVLVFGVSRLEPIAGLNGQCPSLLPSS